MKATKQIVAFLLSFVMLLTMIPAGAIMAFAATEYTYENFTYTVSNNEATITGCVDETVELISIPASVDGYSVTAIGSFAFQSYKQLTTIWFSHTVKTIGYGAFNNCDALVTIEIPDNVTTINYSNYSGGGAFSDCDNLQEVVIGEGLKSIQSHTFNECPKLEKVYIGNSVETIGTYAFSGSAIETIVIPNSVKKIDNWAFQGCKELSGVLLGNSLETIGYGAFNDCDSLISVNIPNSVTTINYSNYSGGGAFSDCDNLQEVVIGDGLKSIQSHTFNGCPKLESVIIGNSVETIGTYAFSGSAIETIVIPDSTTKIDNWAFQGCKLLAYLDLGNGLQSIGYGAFNDCDNLLSVEIPDSVITINYSNYSGGGAFSDCDNLQEVIIGDGLQSIQSHTFNGCPKLEAVIIGNSVESIGTYAFSGSAIKTITIPDSTIKIENWAFQGCKALYAINLGAGVQTIGYGVFNDCDSLLSVEIPDSVITINYSNYSGGGAFSDCDNLQEVIIGDGLQSIQSHTFNGCPKLESVIIGNSVETIGSYAFSGSAIETIVIPDSTKKIDNWAFQGCKLLSAVKLGDGLETIGYGAFNDCDSLLSIELPDSLTTINYSNYSGGGAFSDCKNLREIIVGDGLEIIKTRLFDNCTKLSTVVVGKSVNSIENYALANCPNLRAVLIFDNVTSISDSAFESSEQVEFYGYDGSYAQEYALAHSIPFHIVSHDLSIEEILAGITSRKVDMEFITGEYIGTYTGPQGLMGLEFDIYYADDLLENKTKLEEVARKATIASVVYDDGKEIPQKVFSWRDIHTAVRNYSGSYIAIFYYFENAENEGVETGVYISTAKYDNEENTYSFIGTEWLQHDTYDFADIKNATLDGDYIVGEIWGQGSSGGIWWGTTYQELGSVIVKKEGKAYSLPQDSLTHKGHTYKLIEQNVTWKQAETICKQMGGHLVTLNNSAEKTFVEQLASSMDSVWLGGFSENDVWYWSTGEDFVTSVLDVEVENGYLVYQNGEYFAATGDSTTYFICEWNYTNSGSLESSIKEGNALFNVFDYETFETVNANITYDDLNKTLTITAAGYNTVCLTDISCVSGQTYSFAMVRTNSNTGVSAVRCNGYDALLSNSVSGISDKTLDIKVYSAVDNVLKYQLIQDGTVIAESETGAFSIPSSKLLADKIVKIRLIAIDGSKYSTLATKVYHSSFSAQNVKVSGGSAFEVTMPDAFGGYTFGLDLSVIPLIVTDDGSTLRIGIGAKEKLGETEQSKKEKCKNLKETVEQYLSKGMDKGLSEIEKYKAIDDFKAALNKKGIIAEPHAVQKGFSISVFGYLDLKYNENGYQKATGRAIITISGKVSNQWQVIVGVVPIVVKAELGGKVTTDVQVGYDIANSQWFCEGDLTISLPEVKITAGFGVAYVADISGYGSAKNVVKLNTKEDTVTATLYGELGVSATLLFAHYEHKLLSGSWQYYYKDKSGEYYGEQATTFRSLYRLSNYSVDRNYLNSRSGWNVGDVMLLSTSGANSVEEIVTSKTLQESINYSATPKLLKLDDATDMLVWTMDIEDRTDGNHTAIVYSIHNVILDTWTDPVIIDDDGTADFYPEVLYSNGNVYVIWSDANKQFEEGFDLSDVISSCEITYAVYGKYTKSFGVATTITADSTADVKPVLVDNNGKVVAVWLNNPNNDLLTQSGTNYLMLKDLSSGTDIQSVIITENPILSVAPIVVDGQLAVAYTQDLDGDLMTTADVEVFVYRNGTSTQLTANSESEGYLFAEVLNGKQCLVFYSDSGLKVSYDLASVSSLLGTAGTTEYDIVTQDGKDIIVYAVAAGEVTQLYGCVVGNSSSEVLIGEVKGTVKDLTAVSSIDSIVLSYVSSTQNAETLETSYNLCSAVFDLFTDLTVYVNQDEVNHAGTTLVVPVEITNTGMETVNGYIVNVYNETDTLIYSQVIEESLLVGEVVTRTVTIEGIAFPEQIKDYVVEVLPVSGIVESNTNSEIFSIGFIDLSIDASSFGTGENVVFLVDLKNNSDIVTAATVVVKDETGSVIKIYSVEGFDGEYSFVIEVSELELAAIYHFEVIGDREEFFLGNNSDVGFMPNHIYDDDWDADCNACGAVREVVTAARGDADGNGRINNRDLGLLQRYLNDWHVTIDLLVMDISGDGRINNQDLGLLQRYLNEWDVESK